MSEDITLNELYRQKPNVGVYVCHCGGNISDVVDVKKVVEEISRYHNVFVVRDYAFMCSAVGQSLIEEDIKRGVNRVVIAACMPALHE
ncbi:MAG: methyl-viologen-reducing hydrogenase subunit delta, partial [Elusimicrobiales bacterium]|nr:methyl-viologen-reducing hydrogenase subunit delta [Elusimicrobiales bacterium]